MKILVVDDHGLVREGLRHVLKGLDAEAEVLEAPRGKVALALVAANPDVDLVLLDLNLPDMHGIEVLELIGQQQPDLPVVVLSGTEDAELMRKVLDRGAVGFIPKSTLSEVVVSALKLVLAGGVYVPPQILSARPAPTNAPRVGATPLPITPRQVEVLALMLDGSSNKDIARTLQISESTVKEHVTAILRALDVRTRTQAVMAATRLGYRSGSSH
jgi:DNA-binding NarL/FixJ family response regulator